MLNPTIWLLLLCLGAGGASGADLLELKGDAGVMGRILAEKPDQVAIDIGYTVLVIPRSQIVKITTGLPRVKTGSPEPKTTEVTEEAVQAVLQRGRPELDPISPPSEEKARFYRDGDSTRPDRSVREWVTRVGQAVVQVRTPGGIGSGFIVNSEGFLITNFHVIQGETQISVEVYHQADGQLTRHTFQQVRIVAMNKFADLALLRIEDKDAPKFAAVSLGDTGELAVGERVFAVGSPMGLERTVTEGIVSSKTRPMSGELFLQTTTQINPGNSGGPLFNLRGEVVGVTNMKLAFGEGLGFAIPIESVKYFLNHRDAFAYTNDNPSSPYHYLEPPRRIRGAAPEE